MKPFLYRLSFGLLLVLFGLSACGERLSSHGHLIDEYDLRDVVIGESTKTDILFALGKPSFEGAFDSGKIYYVSQNMVQPAGGRQETTKREIFAFLFDENDILTEITVTDETTGLEIATLKAKTPTPGAEFGVIEQIFSNIRRRNTRE
ncbi:MAG: outer membrane protein assembly factor BamE [Candidatus Puniceispirillaceae bacterium]